MTTTTNVGQVKLNVMTEAQYTSATKNTNELYMVTDAKVPASDISGLATVATSGAYSDLTGKPTVDQTYSSSSTNAQSGTAVANAISGKQDTLVSGTTIKTINNTSILGSGNISVGVSMSYNSSTETLTIV